MRGWILSSALHGVQNALRMDESGGNEKLWVAWDGVTEVCSGVGWNDGVVVGYGMDDGVL